VEVVARSADTTESILNDASSMRQHEEEAGCRADGDDDNNTNGEEDKEGGLITKSPR
jgi:ATP-dependent protease ClpP protease subunit